MFVLLGVFGDFDPELWSHAWCPSSSQALESQQALRKAARAEQCPGDGAQLAELEPSRWAGFGFVIALTWLYLGFGQVLLARSSRDQDFQAPVQTVT